MSAKYLNQPSIVVRCSDDPDPTAGGYVELEFAFTSPDIQPLTEGEGTEDYAGGRRGGELWRWRFFFELLPLQIRDAWGDEFRTIGDLNKFDRLEKEYEYTWLYRVREIWGDEASRFLYAEEDGDDTFFNLAADAEPGILPHLVQIASISRSPVDAGLITAELALESRVLD